MREEIIATIPQDEAGVTLEVALVHPEAEDACIELRHLVWGKGLGWYRQKTLRLEAPAARSILRALGAGAASAGACRQDCSRQEGYSVSGGCSHFR